MSFISKAMCAVFGHRYFVMRQINRGTRKLGCLRCGGAWGMHDATRSVIPWDADLEALYAKGGPLDPEYDPREVAFKTTEPTHEQ